MVFPFGFPQYDERLTRLDWAAGEKKILKAGAWQFEGYVVGGTCLQAFPSLKPSESLFSELESLIGKVQEGLA